MPKAGVGGVSLYYEEVGQGTPLVFVHEFAGDCWSWRPQVQFFSRRYRTIAFNARGYPPSDVPLDVKAYSQQQAADDIKGVLDHLGIRQAHVCGLSMGGYATLHFGLSYPERALSLVVAGAGYRSDAQVKHQAVGPRRVPEVRRGDQPGGARPLQPPRARLPHGGGGGALAAAARGLDDGLGDPAEDDLAYFFPDATSASVGISSPPRDANRSSRARTASRTARRASSASSRSIRPKRIPPDAT